MPPYLQPMVDYIRTKENTGVYNSRRSVHMPVEVALQAADRVQAAVAWYADDCDWVVLRP